jgi:hypothetical protein
MKNSLIAVPAGNAVVEETVAVTEVRVLLVIVGLALTSLAPGFGDAADVGTGWSPQDYFGIVLTRTKCNESCP